MKKLAKMLIKRPVQLIMGKLLGQPYFSKSGLKAFSLIRSQRINLHQSVRSKIYSPFVIRNVVLGDYSYVQSNCNISNAEIGKFCSIGPNFCCGMGIHPIHGVSTAPMFYSTAHQNGFSLVKKNMFKEDKLTVIKNDVFIGVNVTILDGVIIGDGAVIAAGSVVTKDVPDFAVVAGVPAKILKYRFDEDTILKLKATEWWNSDDENLKKVRDNLFDVTSFLKEFDK